MSICSSAASRVVSGFAHRVGERVEVDDDEVDLLDAVLGQLGEVVRLVASGEEAGEDRGVEGLDAPAEDLVRLGQVGDRPHAGMPCSVRWARVPSVAKHSIFASTRPRASSTIPSRSETERRARNRQPRCGSSELGGFGDVASGGPIIGTRLPSRP